MYLLHSTGTEFFAQPVHTYFKGDTAMTAEQEMIEGLKIAAGAGLFIGFVVASLAMTAGIGG